MLSIQNCGSSMASLLVIGILISVSSCSSDGALVESPPHSLDEHQNELPKAPRGLALPPEMGLPFSDLMAVDPVKSASVGAAQRFLENECMRKRGFPTRPFPEILKETAYIDLDDASWANYGAFPGISKVGEFYDKVRESPMPSMNAQQQPERDDDVELSEEYQKALAGTQEVIVKTSTGVDVALNKDGCYQESLNELYGGFEGYKAWQELLSQREDLKLKIRDDMSKKQAHRELFESIERCLKNSGVTDGAQAKAASFSNAENGDLFACKRQSSFTQTMINSMKEIETQRLTEYPQFPAEFQAANASLYDRSMKVVGWRSTT